MQASILFSDLANWAPMDKANSVKSLSGLRTDSKGWCQSLVGLKPWILRDKTPALRVLVPERKENDLGIRRYAACAEIEIGGLQFDEIGFTHGFNEGP